MGADMRSKPLATLGITGGTGSGKTTLALEICRALGPGNGVILHQDFYYLDLGALPLDDRQRINFDHPSALDLQLLKTHVDTLRNGNLVQVPTYNFHTHTRMPETLTIAPHPVVLVEGILLFHDPELRGLFDLRVFVDTDADLRFIRRVQRDVRERGRSLESVVDQYLTTVRPMHQQFVEPAKQYADVIVPEGGQNRPALEGIMARVRALMESAHRD
jgi:uridine kinase